MPILNRIFSRRTLAYVTGSTALVTGGGYWYLNSGPAYPASTRETRRAPPPWTPPSREEMLASLERSGKVKRLGSSPKVDEGKGEDDEDIFDLLIVGGGATGAGVAVDAASRGLKVALVERDDFSAGTSSKSTKLVHGGVRYLQKAVFELDYDQYKLVKEALHERKIFLHTAPYLSSMLPIMLPIYKYWQIPYYYAGCKMYDVLAGKENMETSYLMSKGKAIEAFPMIKQDGLVGALVYYDGQHNDSRMNIALILTAVKLGAVAANYVEVTDLKKDENGKVNGARVKDTLSGKEWDVRARGVINATGPFSDTLLSLDSPSHIPIVQPSAGIHITLPNYYSPRKMGLLDPATSDGRVIFFLPWQGNTIAGTTDTKAEVEREPRAQEEEIRWVLEEVRRYLSPDIKVRRGDVLSAWSGLRPLVRNPNSSGTEGLVRSHIVHVSESGLLTIAGGKWTTYREMAEEAVDKAVESFGLRGRCKTEGGKCVTENLRLVGSEGWSRNLFIGLVQRYGIETEVAKHLSENYGDRSWTVLSLSSPTGLSWPLHGIRLVPSYPFIEAEVRYAVRHEYAQTAIDVLARRTRLSFLNVQAAMDALPRVVDIMAEEKGWSWGRKEREVKECVRWLKTMGLGEVGEEGVPRVIPRGVWESTLAWGKYSLLQSVLHPLTWVKGGNVGRGAEGVGKGMTIPGAASRARFERGELAALTAAFDKHAHTVTSKEAGRDGEVEEVVDVAGLRDIVRCSGVRGYEEVSEKEWRYVLEEAGVLGKERGGVDYDTFIEICGNLKEVAFAPEVMSKTQKAERKRIPVEKSGGGV